MPEPRRVLVLGGTGEARRLVEPLAGLPDVRPVTSLAGRTRHPVAPAGQLRSGGFGGAEGLALYLRSEKIAAVIDATHPFATRITANAVRACRKTGMPYLRLDRPRWPVEPGDRWLPVADALAAAETLRGLAARVFLTTGHGDLGAFAGLVDIWFLVRLVEDPVEPLPLRRCRLLVARGPFLAEDEERTMSAHGVEALVTKQSGGGETYGKIVAARRLGLPVVMIERPPVPDCERVETVEAALAWLSRTLL